MKRLIIAASVLMLAACNSVSEPVDDVLPLLEIEYTNYAWVPTWYGYVVQASGDVTKYDRKGAPWTSAEKTSGTVTELQDKYQPDRTNVASKDVSAVPAQIAQVDPSATTPPQGRCADAGYLSYYAYTYKSGTYTRILLWRGGDQLAKNTSPAAQQLVTYIRSLNLINEPQGCTP